MNNSLSSFNLICVSHLPPLMGKPSFSGYKSLRDHAFYDLEAAVEGGASGLLLENEQDNPYTLRATPEGISSMTKLALELAEQAPASFSLGVEFLIHDPQASLAVAKTANFSFIRTDYFVDRMARQEYGGEIKVNPKEVISYREKISASDISIYADIQVKYAENLEPEKPLTMSARQGWQEGAKAVVLSGTITGVAPSIVEVKEVGELSDRGHVFIGSGFSVENAEDFLPYIDGAIVGTSLMKERKLQKDKIEALSRITRS
jgi:membrane complex biogenesis BtpA family protein